jgi:hypothetical protein
MISQDLNNGGIWKRKGECLDEGTFEQDVYRLSVMVWGAIGTGFRSPLLRCLVSVNAESDMRVLAEGYVFGSWNKIMVPKGSGGSRIMLLRTVLGKR